MAGTAHALVVSLLNTMDQTQIHPFLSTCFDRYQFESLRGKVDFFLDFVENYPDADSNEAEDLVRRIAGLAHEAEDIIEVEAADLIRDGSTERSPSFFNNLQKIIGDMDSIIKEEVIQLKEARPCEDDQPISPMAPSSSSSSTVKTTAMVGFEGYVEKLLDELTGHHPNRRILPIVGMGGIGKTTLARNVYEHSLIVYHFDVRVWVTVSQSFSVGDILFKALSCLRELSSSTIDGDGDGLGEELYRILYGRRYLIVLDDVWSVEAWEKVKFFFPENNNGSRIVVTTRQQEVVDFFASSALALDFLDDKQSWDLFCDMTFGREGCPSELEDVGRKIVRKCKGLPLAVIVIGGLLGKSPRGEYWEKIAKDKSLILENSSDEGNQVLNILYLSYKSLPVWLKSCFLYVGLFPEFKVSQLIQYLMAEGFIKANGMQSMEEVAESYIKDLVDRNLLLINGVKLNKKLKSCYCYLHDLVRELCISISEKENFYSVQRYVDGMCQYIGDQTSARFYPPEAQRYIDWMRRKYIADRTMVRFYPLEAQRYIEEINQLVIDQASARPHTPEAPPFDIPLHPFLRVCVDRGNYNGTFQQFNLRLYNQKSRRCSMHVSWSISLCWSLQTLILAPDSQIELSQIWKMPQLRHIKVSSSMHLPVGDDAIVLQNLQTLKRVKMLNLSEDVCQRIPNVKELGIEYNFYEQSGARYFNLQNIECLHKLEKLKYFCRGMEYASIPVQNLTLPASLKELTLSGCHLFWSDMAMVASLPHLQILKLHEGAVVGGEWNCVDEFHSLKHLNVGYGMELTNWIAESSNFPVLETLFLGSLSKLEEIPLSIGDIPTLEAMSVCDCTETITMSAIKIIEEQESLGNQDLRLQLYSSFSTTRADMWREKIQELGYTGQNIHISSRFGL